MKSKINILGLDLYGKWMRLKIFLGILVAHISILLYNSLTLNVWEDEVDGFYLSIKSFSDMLSHLLNNFLEDPPLYYIILHYWISIFGDTQITLRVLSLIFWLFVLWFSFVITKRLTKSHNTAILSVILLCIMPYHWLFPIAIRWYSLSAVAVLANLYFFILIIEEDRLRNKNNTWFALIGYIVSGSILWYTNYLAPIYFLAGGLIVLFFYRYKSTFFSLFICWIIIFISYLPWLSTFIAQLKYSVGKSHAEDSIIDILLSLFVMVAGESALPWHWHISIPLLLGSIGLLYLIYHARNELFQPLIFFIVSSFGMIITGVIWTKRLMLITPFLGIIGSIAIIKGWKERKRYTMFVIVSILIGSSFSAWNMWNRTNWISWRWLDNYKYVAQMIIKEHQQSLVVTNSESLFYYLDSPKGPYQQLELKDKPKIPNEYSCIYTPVLLNMKNAEVFLKNYDKIVYVHGSFGTSYGSQTKMNQVSKLLINQGFRLNNKLPIQHDHTLYWKKKALGLQRSDLPEHRIEVLFFSI